MTCPRCHQPPTIGRRFPGEHPIYCVNGPLGSPCGERILEVPKVPRGPRVIAEKHVMRAALAWLKHQPGVFVERINVARFGPDGGRQYQSAKKGSADLHVLVEGRALFVELKAPGKKQSPAQVEYQRKVESAGATYVVEDSLGLETLKAAVAQLRRRSA